MRSKGLICLLWLVLLPATVFAHKPSDSYLTLDLRAMPPQLRWDIALRDLEQAIGIDRNGDHQLSWGEVQQAHAAIANYATGRLVVRAADRPCHLQTGAQSLVDHSDGGYTVLPLTVDCAGAEPSSLRYALLFDIDPTHRGQLRTLRRSGETLHQFSSDQPLVLIQSGTEHQGMHLFLEQLGAGVRHIPLGLDHVLFLLTLLLPAVMYRRDGAWQPLRSNTRIGWNVLSVITAFTAAHSFTLSLAVFGLFEVSGNWVEPAIAGTVLLAALNNLQPFLPGRPWAIAFVLGLVHGLGFAFALTDLGLSPKAMLLALSGFNIGVELGQLLIVLLLLPILCSMRATRFYRVAGLQLGSVAIAAFATVWLLERTLHFQLVPL